MNTYELLNKDTLKLLSDDDQNSILEFLQDNNTKENVSIQLQYDIWGDDSNTTIYGLYDMNDDELYNYYSCGGTWWYMSKLNLLDILI
jgi:hypothetical protein